jgi:hypothetical protein
MPYPTIFVNNFFPEQAESLTRTESRMRYSPDRQQKKEHTYCYRLATKAATHPGPYETSRID